VWQLEPAYVDANVPGMRQGQASVEVAVATLLVVGLLAAAWVVASSAWTHAETTVARVAGTQAGLRGRDPMAAARSAVPSFVRPAVQLQLARNAPAAAVAR
jgi:hypothetical protein